MASPLPSMAGAGMDRNSRSPAPSVTMAGRLTSSLPTSPTSGRAPGFIPVERHANVAPQITNAYLASVPAGRMGTPEDIAHAVSFLASEGAGFITGQRIVVDGGRALGS